MECEAYDVVFLKARLAVLCNKGFRITEVNGYVIFFFLDLLRVMDWALTLFV